jgi:EpsI family protein
MSVGSRRGWVLFGLMAVTAIMAGLMRLEVSAASHGPPAGLSVGIPEQFADWHVDDSASTGVVSPEVRQAMDGLYSDQISRTYVDAQGHRVMLVIAYSSDQGSEQSQVHRPEVCYTAQGFSIRRVEDVTLKPADRALEVRRLVGERGRRYEPITYWTTMGDRALLPGTERLATRIRMALQRKIPDGFLVRVSTVGLAMPEAYAVQDRFINALMIAATPELRTRLLGMPA